MTLRLKHLALGFLVATAIAATPVPPANAPVQDWSNVEVVTVTPERPGPAMWHIAKGNSEVWIVPTVSPVPKDLTWDTSGIADVLKGAKGLLLPPRASIGLAEGLWFLMWHRDTLEQPDGVKLESTLPEKTRERFIAARTRIGQDADRYEDYLGGIAALRLESDTFKFLNMTQGGPQRTIEKIASSNGVPSHATATYSAMDVVNDVPSMGPQAHVACMNYALSDIDVLTAHAARAAAAWARGDVVETKAHYLETKLEDCLAASPAFRTLREHANRDMTNAILTVLQKPGKTVAVMPLGFFLRKGGVLERLEAAGLTVAGPGI